MKALECIFKGMGRENGFDFDDVQVLDEKHGQDKYSLYFGPAINNRAVAFTVGTLNAHMGDKLKPKILSGINLVGDSPKQLERLIQKLEKKLDELPLDDQSRDKAKSHFKEAKGRSLGFF